MYFTLTTEVTIYLEVGVSLPEQQDVLVVGDDPLVGDDQPLGVDKG